MMSQGKAGGWYASSMLSTIERTDLSEGEQDDDLLDEATDIFLSELSERHDSALFDRRVRVAGFNQRLHSRWREAFEALEFAILAHEQAGVLYKVDHDLKYPNDEDKSYEYSALVRLHARACQIAQEILTLVRAGYADGAMARWRALFEIGTVADFIADHGNETAERFLKFSVRETLREAEEYEEYYENLGFAPVEDGVIEDLREEMNELRSEYGNSFDSNYGWAEQDLDGDASRRAVAREVGTVKFMPFYAFASNAIHGGSKGTQYRLGLTEETQGELLSVGPTNVGFTDPAQLTSLMLHRVTAALLGLGEVSYWKVIVRALDEIAHEVPEMFVTTPVKSSVQEASSELTNAIMEQVKEQMTEREGIDMIEDIEVDDIEIDEILDDVFDLEANK